MVSRRTIVIGIDVGTSGTKAIAVSESGAVLASCTSNYELSAPMSGWAEQQPEDWWAATAESVKGLMQRIRELDGEEPHVASISFSGQMHGLVPLDADGNVIRPSIIWCDLRSVEEAKWLEETVGRESIIEWTQNPPLPNFTLTKLLWMKRHEPSGYARIAKILLPKDYVRYRMTGELAMDAADASGTLLFDVARRAWSEEMCKAADIPLNWLPTVCESNQVAGVVSRSAAQVLGVPEGTPVVAGAGDQAAGAVGLGIVEPGGVSVVFGTSGVVLAPTEQPIRDARGSLHTFCHAVPGRWFVMGVTQAAGGSLQWYRRRFFSGAAENAYNELMELAEEAPAGSENLIFLPYIMGERTPHLDPNARGAWVGLDWRHTPAHMVRSLLEGVAFSLFDCWQVMKTLSVHAEHWRVSGGGAQGRIWMEIFSSVLQLPVEVMHGAQGPAFGAAILAAEGVGLSTSQWVTPGTVVSYPEGWPEVYQRLYPLYQASYQGLKDVYAKLLAQ